VVSSPKQACRRSAYWPSNCDGGLPTPVYLMIDRCRKPTHCTGKVGERCVAWRKLYGYQEASRSRP